MVREAVECPTCGGTEIYRHGHSATGKNDTSVEIQNVRAEHSLLTTRTKDICRV